MGYAFLVEPNEQKGHKSSALLGPLELKGSHQPCLSSLFSGVSLYHLALISGLSASLSLGGCFLCLTIHTMEPGDGFHLLLILLAMARSFSLSSS